jgi:hypothetical protein
MSNHRDWLSNKDKIENARMLNWMSRAEDKRYLEHNMKSAELIAYSFGRGMSRAHMVRIWGEKLVNAIVGLETTKSVKDEEPKGIYRYEKVFRT